MNTHDQTPFDIDLDPWRPVFHVAPPSGLLNDPNGLVFWQGRHHAFFQWNPKGCTHENKSWGHRASADLVHWETMPIALEPTDRFDAQDIHIALADLQGFLPRRVSARFGGFSRRNGPMPLHTIVQ